MRVLKATTALLSAWELECRKPPTNWMKRLFGQQHSWNDQFGCSPGLSWILRHHCIDLFVKAVWVYVQVGSPETFLFTVAPSQGSPRLVAEGGLGVRRFFLLLLCFAASAFFSGKKMGEENVHYGYSRKHKWCVVNCARHWEQGKLQMEGLCKVP